MPITPTRGSLLSRLSSLDDEKAWEIFHAAYAPTIYRFARECGLRPVDAEDVRDQVFVILTRKLPEFRYDPERGRFRGWLYRVTHGLVVDLLRAASPTRLDTDIGSTLADGAATPSQAWERACRAGELVAAMEQACAEARDQDAEAFRYLVTENRSASEVAEELGLTRDQVYKAKSRIMARVRELIDASS